MRKKTQKFRIYGNIKSRLCLIILAVIVCVLLFTPSSKANENVFKRRLGFISVSVTGFAQDALLEKQIKDPSQVPGFILPMTDTPAQVTQQVKQHTTGNDESGRLRLAECSKNHKPPPEEIHPPPAPPPPPQQEPDKKPEPPQKKPKVPQIIPQKKKGEDLKQKKDWRAIQRESMQKRMDAEKRLKDKLKRKDIGELEERDLKRQWGERDRKLKGQINNLGSIIQKMKDEEKLSAQEEGKSFKRGVFGPQQGETLEEWTERLARNIWQSTYDKVLLQRAQERANRQRMGLGRSRTNQAQYDQRRAATGYDPDAEEDKKWAKYYADQAAEAAKTEHYQKWLQTASEEELMRYNLHRDGTARVAYGRPTRGSGMGPSLDYSKADAVEEKQKKQRQAANKSWKARAQIQRDDYEKRTGKEHILNRQEREKRERAEKKEKARAERLAKQQAKKVEKEEKARQRREKSFTEKQKKRSAEARERLKELEEIDRPLNQKERAEKRRLEYEARTGKESYKTREAREKRERIAKKIEKKAQIEARREAERQQELERKTKALERKKAREEKTRMTAEKRKKRAEERKKEGKDKEGGSPSEVAWVDDKGNKRKIETDGLGNRKDTTRKKDGTVEVVETRADGTRIRTRTTKDNKTTKITMRVDEHGNTVEIKDLPGRRKIVTKTSTDPETGHQVTETVETKTYYVPPDKHTTRITLYDEDKGERVTREYKWEGGDRTDTHRERVVRDRDGNIIARETVEDSGTTYRTDKDGNITKLGYDGYEDETVETLYGMNGLVTETRKDKEGKVTSERIFTSERTKGRDGTTLLTVHEEGSEKTYRLNSDGSLDFVQSRWQDPKDRGRDIYLKQKAELGLSKGWNELSEGERAEYNNWQDSRDAAAARQERRKKDRERLAAIQAEGEQRRAEMEKSFREEEERSRRELDKKLAKIKAERQEYLARAEKHMESYRRIRRRQAADASLNAIENIGYLADGAVVLSGGLGGLGANAVAKGATTTVTRTLSTNLTRTAGSALGRVAPQAVKNLGSRAANTTVGRLAGNKVVQQLADDAALGATADVTVQVATKGEVDLTQTARSLVVGTAVGTGARGAKGAVRRTTQMVRGTKPATGAASQAAAQKASVPQGPKAPAAAVPKVMEAAPKGTKVASAPKRMAEGLKSREGPMSTKAESATPKTPKTRPLDEPTDIAKTMDTLDREFGVTPRPQPPPRRGATPLEGPVKGHGPRPGPGPDIMGPINQTPLTASTSGSGRMTLRGDGKAPAVVPSAKAPAVSVRPKTATSDTGLPRTTPRTARAQTPPPKGQQAAKGPKAQPPEAITPPPGQPQPIPGHRQASLPDTIPSPPARSRPLEGADFKTASPLPPKDLPPTVLGKPGPGVRRDHIDAVQKLANETGETVVIYGSRQTYISRKSGRQYSKGTDLDIGVVGDANNLSNMWKGDWKSIPDMDPIVIKDGVPIGCFSTEEAALNQGYLLVRPRKPSGSTGRPLATLPGDISPPPGSPPPLPGTTTKGRKPGPSIEFPGSRQTPGGKPPSIDFPPQTASRKTRAKPTIEQPRRPPDMSDTGPAPTKNGRRPDITVPPKQATTDAHDTKFQIKTQRPVAEEFDPTAPESGPGPSLKKAPSGRQDDLIKQALKDVEADPTGRAQWPTRPDYIPSRGDLLSNVIDKHYEFHNIPKSKMPRIHVTKNLPGLKRSLQLDQPAGGGTAWSFKGTGTLSSSGNTAIRIRPECERYYNFKKNEWGAGEVAEYWPSGQKEVGESFSYVRTRDLQYFEPGSKVGEGKWVDVRPRTGR